MKRLSFLGSYFLENRYPRLIFMGILTSAVTSTVTVAGSAIASTPISISPNQTAQTNPPATSQPASQPVNRSTPPNVIRSTPNPSLISQTGVLRREDRGVAVTDLQAQLAELGYYNGGLTEYFGELTERAVILFQQDMGLTADGVVGPSTQTTIRREITRRRQEVTPPAASTTLQLNDSGEQVAALQRRLTTLGYYNGAASGLFDRPTELAVIEFQRQNNLTADGIVGPSTQATLSRPAAEVGVRPVKTTYTFGSRVLQIGDSGNDVATLQDRLRDLGFYSGQTTGTFGSVTQTAVIAFQRSQNLIDDGIVGPAVYNALGGSASIDPRRGQ